MNIRLADVYIESTSLIKEKFSTCRLFSFEFNQLNFTVVDMKLNNAIVDQAALFVFTTFEFKQLTFLNFEITNDTVIDWNLF